MYNYKEVTKMIQASCKQQSSSTNQDNTKNTKNKCMCTQLCKLATQLVMNFVNTYKLLATTVAIERVTSTTGDLL